MLLNKKKIKKKGLLFFRKGDLRNKEWLKRTFEEFKVSDNKISSDLVNSFNEEMTYELAKRLEEENYATPFDGLKDWHLLRALAINRPELTSDYIHLLDQEPFDEN